MYYLNSGKGKGDSNKMDKKHGKNVLHKNQYVLLSDFIQYNSDNINFQL